MNDVTRAEQGHGCAVPRALAGSYQNAGFAQIARAIFRIVNQNLIPAIGAVRLNKLKPIQISAAYSAALESSRRDGSGLSPRTVGHMHRA